VSLVFQQTASFFLIAFLWSPVGIFHVSQGQNSYRSSLHMLKKPMASGFTYHLRRVRITQQAQEFKCSFTGKSVPLVRCTAICGARKCFNDQSSYRNGKYSTIVMMMCWDPQVPLTLMCKSWVLSYPPIAKTYFTFCARSSWCQESS
jgi:hypothetical protein